MNNKESYAALTIFRRHIAAILMSQSEAKVVITQKGVIRAELLLRRLTFRPLKRGGRNRAKPGEMLININMLFVAKGDKIHKSPDFDRLLYKGKQWLSGLGCVNQTNQLSPQKDFA